MPDDIRLSCGHVVDAKAWADDQYEKHLSEGEGEPGPESDLLGPRNRDMAGDATGPEQEE